MALLKLSGLNERRWQLFKANRRGFWSLWIFLVLFAISVFAPFIANDRPILASYKGEFLFPTFTEYPEEKFGGFLARTDFRDPFIQDEIKANGWMVWPPIRYSYNSVNNELPTPAPSRPAFQLSGRRPAPNIRSRPRIPIASAAISTGSAPTTRAAMWWRGSSTASAYRCSSASS